MNAMAAKRQGVVLRLWLLALLSAALQATKLGAQGAAERDAVAKVGTRVITRRDIQQPFDVLRADPALHGATERELREVAVEREKRRLAQAIVTAVLEQAVAEYEMCISDRKRIVFRSD